MGRAERENKCPLCKNRFNKIDRVNKTRKKGSKNSKKVKTRDQRSDIVPGAALEGLIANLNRNSGSLARIIFGGFEFGGSIHSTSSSGANSARAGFRHPAPTMEHMTTSRTTKIVRWLRSCVHSMELLVR